MTDGRLEEGITKTIPRRMGKREWTCPHCGGKMAPTLDGKYECPACGKKEGGA